jgi:mannose-6-phosphate isomerase-like protein (cupin superfamily)
LVGHTRHTIGHPYYVSGNAILHADDPAVLPLGEDVLEDLQFGGKRNYGFARRKSSNSVRYSGWRRWTTDTPAEELFADSAEHISMDYSKVRYDEVDPIADAMHFLREPLDCEQMGLTVVECDPGWEGKPHDHADDGQEEVYLLTEGEATVTVDDEGVSLSAGDALRIPPESRRQIHNGDTESTFVIAGAP